MLLALQIDPRRIITNLPRQLLDGFGMQRRREEGDLQAAVARRRAGPLRELLEDLEAGGDLCVEINQWVECTKSFLGDDAAVLAPSSGEAHGTATPSSRRRVDGVEDDAMISTRVATSSVSMNRSASSSVKKRQASTSMMPLLTKSQTFNGVPVTISISPFLRACSASFVLMPPISNAHLMCGSCKYLA